jgi:hypothetical protein
VAGSHHTPDSTADVKHRFAFHAATTEEKRAEHGSVRAACLDLGLQFDRDLPPGREKSLALTKLEEAMFWANAGIARARPGNLMTTTEFTVRKAPT